MRKQILCLCVAILFLLSGCGNRADNPQKNDSTTSPTSTITTTITTTTESTTIVPTDSDDTTTTSTTGATDSSQSTITVTSTTSHTTTSTSGSSTTTQTSKTTSAITTGATTVSTSPSTSVVPTTCPNTTFTATVRNDQQQTVSDVTVTVWASNDVMIGRGVTNDRGIARITLADYPVHSYRVTLGNLPTGYEANAEYIFSSTTVNITIRKAAVQNEADHSQAQYAVGKKMTNFTLTDTDGNSYQLYDLLKEKQLVVLDFWYTSCEPCKMEFPYFEAAVQKYGNKMQLLAVDPIDNNNSITRLRNQLNANDKTAITFPMMRDTCNLSLGFGVYTYPTTVFIDSNGIIMDIHIGAYESESAFFKAVERYIH